MIDFEKLKEPFPPEKISWRVGRVSKEGNKASALAYIDARDVMERLDTVCTPSGWQNKYSHAEGKTICDIGLNVGDTWVWKADGAGDSDIEAEKGALSDAFKRAAVRWGIGRYLYDIASPWVKIDQYKKIEASELERLARLLPNAPQDSVKVVGLNGLSKTPAKFWSNAKLTVPLKEEFLKQTTENNGKWTEEALAWWCKEFKRGIDKAPTRELLAQYQEDNQHIIDMFPAIETQKICDACAIRAEQFKEFE